ncbi:unnamed protein product [Caenorhabditis sp. 36 PRJEB53466]|nr:unnamed protein product [Caenorhabditis sp. 36 PRJEB53466]
MNRVHDHRLEQLRAIEADLLSPPPEDPFQSFPKGWIRAADLKTEDWDRMSRERSMSPPPREPSPVRRVMRRTPPRHNNRVMPINVPERRAARQLNAVARRARTPVIRRQPIQQNDPMDVENIPPVPAVDLRRRPLSPTQLPGVRAIPKDFNRYFRGLLTPGEYFAKSQSRYLGPFETMPTAATLPADDEYIILQRMGRLPDSGKSIFRQVGNVST